MYESKAMPVNGLDDGRRCDPRPHEPKDPEPRRQKTPKVAMPPASVAE